MSPAGIVSTGSIGDRAGAPADPAAAFVQRGEVAVEVAGVGAPARDLAPGRGHLPQRLGVAGHVGHHHEHVAAALEGQVLGDGERDPRGEDPLDHRVVGGVEQQHQLARPPSAPRARRARRPRRRGSGPSPRRPRRTARPPRWPARRSGWRARGAAGPATEKIGSFWPRTSVVSASMAETPVRTGSAGGSARRRVERGPPTGARRRAEDRRPAVERLPAAVAHPAQPARRRPGCCSGSPANATRVPLGSHALGALQHLDHRQVAVDLEDQPVARPRRSPAGPAQTRPSPTPAHAAHDQQRAAQLGDVGVLDAPVAATRATPVLTQPLQPCEHGVPAVQRRRRRRRGRSPRAPAAAAPKSTSSIAAAGTPALDQRVAAVDHRRARRRRSAAPFAGEQNASFGLQRALLQHAPRAAAGRRASPPARARAARRRRPARPGRRAGRPRRAGRSSAPAGAAQPGSPLRACQAAERVGVPGERPGPATPPGSAARRRGRGRGSTAAGRTAAVCGGHRLGHVAAGR